MQKYDTFIENDKIKVHINKKDCTLHSIELKKYKDSYGENQNLVFLSKKSGEAQNKHIKLDVITRSNSPLSWSITKNSDSLITLDSTIDSENKVRLKRTIELDGYKILLKDVSTKGIKTKNLVLEGSGNRKNMFFITNKNQVKNIEDGYQNPIIAFFKSNVNGNRQLSELDQKGSCGYINKNCFVNIEFDGGKNFKQIYSKNRNAIDLELDKKSDLVLTVGPYSKEFLKDYNLSHIMFNGSMGILNSMILDGLSYFLKTFNSILGLFIFLLLLMIMLSFMIFLELKRKKKKEDFDIQIEKINLLCGDDELKKTTERARLEEKFHGKEKKYLVLFTKIFPYVVCFYLSLRVFPKCFELRDYKLFWIKNLLESEPYSVFNLYGLLGNTMTTLIKNIFRFVHLNYKHFSFFSIYSAFLFRDLMNKFNLQQQNQFANLITLIIFFIPMIGKLSSVSVISLLFCFHVKSAMEFLFQRFLEKK